MRSYDLRRLTLVAALLAAFLTSAAVALQGSTVPDGRARAGAAKPANQGQAHP